MVSKFLCSGISLRCNVGLTLLCPNLFVDKKEDGRR